MLYMLLTNKVNCVLFPPIFQNNTFHSANTMTTMWFFCLIVLSNTGPRLLSVIQSWKITDVCILLCRLNYWAHLWLHSFLLYSRWHINSSPFFSGFAVFLLHGQNGQSRDLTWCIIIWRALTKCLTDLLIGARLATSLTALKNTRWLVFCWL